MKQGLGWTQARSAGGASLGALGVADAVPAIGTLGAAAPAAADPAGVLHVPVIGGAAARAADQRLAATPMVVVGRAAPDPAPPPADAGGRAGGSASQDRSAARAAYRTSDADAREELVVRHLPLVKHVAARLAMGLPAHIELDDLYSYGVFGLLDALEKFDPARGVKFETYAFTRVKGAILDGLRAMDWVPASMRQRARQVEEAFGRVESRTGRSATDEEVAGELSVDMADFGRLLADIERASLLSLDELWGDDVGDEYALRDLVRDEHAADPTQSAEWKDRESILADAVEALPERERTVLTLFYYDGLAPKEIAAALGVSVSRISQLHSRAVLRLRGHLTQRHGSML